MAKVRQWLSSGPGLSSDVQPNSIHTLSSAVHLWLWCQAVDASGDVKCVAGYEATLHQL